MPATDTNIQSHRTPGSDGSRGSDGTPSTTRPKSADDIADLYADVADSLHRWRWADRLVTGRYRERQFGAASGCVLDVACGTGTNFPYLPVDVDLVGIDISPEMLANAREALDRLPLEGSLRRMDAQSLAFPADSFDTVVSALSTCTFPDPIEALQEMERVCKPDGRILLLEHGRSEVGPLARFQDWRAEAHYEKRGCRWDQEPVALVEQAGLPVVDEWTALLGTVTGIETAPR
ncbi:class I SAM-dependent methyltransferase [Haloglomus litoreum]|uniref:class I SAM-dependent methyltransferase n=1 Tax=Haloglomus litoreum TaxID=3034026 RepID=UPI0023E82F11|nr:class I SAM-dependent methyltransferase [Haloglomus sp. DT116]